MHALRQRVLTHHVYQWADSFLDELETTRTEVRSSPRRLFTAEEIADLAEKLRQAPELLLLLDYDGTLVQFFTDPSQARPDDGLLELLQAVSSLPATRAQVVSGRTWESVDRWLGHLPIGLHAEHGFWSRWEPGGSWTAARDGSSLEWKERVRPILEQFAERTRGAFVEEKTAALVWHYRAVEPEFGALQSRELRLHLAEVLSNTPVEVIPGNKIVEVRLSGVHKGTIAERLAGTLTPATTVVAIGDDRTDEDLFRALPPECFTLHVGPGPTLARYRLQNVAAVRTLLRTLVKARGAG